MVNLINTELLKLKRSQMFLISFFGSMSAPLLCFISTLMKNAKRPDIPIYFRDMVLETNLYMTLIIGVLLYGVITTYLFGREYNEGTLKNLLTIPVSRISLIVSKLVLLFIWILLLTVVVWVLTLLFGLIGPAQGMSVSLSLQACKEFILGGFLLFLLSTPVIFITLLFKNYVPTIVFTIAITLVNLVIYGSEYSALYPWSAVEVIAANHFFPEFPPEYSYGSIIGISIIGFISTIAYFKKVDIH